MPAAVARRPTVTGEALGETAVTLRETAATHHEAETTELA